MNRKQNTSQTTEPAIAVDTVLAPVLKSGCEYVKCKHYVDEKCNDTIDWVNQYGQSVCGRRDDAIHPDDYAEMLENNPPMMNYGGNDSR